MPKYAVVGEDTNTASATQPTLYFVNGATTPGALALYEFIIGHDAAPADNAYQYQIANVTNENATPGGGAVTPLNLVRNGRTSLSNAVEASTADATVTLAFLEIGLNMRATFRWIASPGSEMICDDAEDNGWGIMCIQAATAVVGNYTLLFEE